MTPEQIDLVQASFARVVPASDRAAETFYGRLFEIAPSVQPLFPSGMNEQRKKLMATLAVVVNGLADLGAILPVASALAKKHVGYGVEPQHYGKVGEAPLWTLAHALGPGLDMRDRGGLDRRLRHPVRLHDRRGLRARRRAAGNCRVRTTT